MHKKTKYAQKKKKSNNIIKYINGHELLELNTNCKD